MLLIPYNVSDIYVKKILLYSWGSGCLNHRILTSTEFFETIWFFKVLYSTLLHLPPSDSTVSEDAGAKPRTAAT